MVGGDNGSRFFGLDLVEPGIEDVLDSLVRVNASRKSTATGGFETILTVAFGETKDAQAGTIGLLRMFAGGEKRLHELGCVRPDGLSPAREPVG